jgi:hypothetical protein
VGRERGEKGEGSGEGEGREEELKKRGGRED